MLICFPSLCATHSFYYQADKALTLWKKGYMRSRKLIEEQNMVV